jgi:uncharacterized protein YndB with AHSA1/START domain
MEEELYPIIIQVTVPLPPAMIFAALSEPRQLTGWLCQEARVEPRVGGAYSLSWTGDPAFTSHGSLTHFTPGVDIGYDWRAPPPFERLMNEPSPKTRVYLRLQESPEGVDVTLEHIGWGSGPEWEDARSWHFYFWDERLKTFKEYLLKTAYG